MTFETNQAWEFLKCQEVFFETVVNFSAVEILLLKLLKLWSWVTILHYFCNFLKFKFYFMKIVLVHLRALITVVSSMVSLKGSKYAIIFFFFRFGVCCLFMVSETGSTINQNCTYVRNPGYPSLYTSTNAISYTIDKCSSGKLVKTL